MVRLWGKVCGHEGVWPKGVWPKEVWPKGGGGQKILNFMLYIKTSEI